MPWIIVFVYSWIIFFIFVDRGMLKKTALGGLIAFALGTLVDWAGTKMGLYRFHDPAISWMGNSLFYVLGPLLTMGTLFFQCISLNRKLQIANVAAFSLAYFGVETSIIWAGGAEYIHWHYLASLLVDLLVFTALTYVGEIIVYGKYTE